MFDAMALSPVFSFDHSAKLPCSAHDWRQVCRFQGKKRPGFGSFTKCTALHPTPRSPSQLYDATPSWPCMAPVSPTPPSSQRWPARSRPANLPGGNGSPRPSPRPALATGGRSRRSRRRRGAHRAPPSPTPRARRPLHGRGVGVGPGGAGGRAPVRDDEGDPLGHIQGLEQGVEVAAVLDEAIRAGATVRQLVGVAHADQVGGDAAASWLQVRQHVAPEVRRGGIAVQQNDGVSLSHLHVRHLAAEDPPPLLLIWKCCRDHVGFSFFLCSGRMSSARYVTLWPSLVLLLVCRVTTLSAFETLSPATWAPPSLPVPQGRDRALSRKGTADGGIVAAAGSR